MARIPRWVRLSEALTSVSEATMDIDGTDWDWKGFRSAIDYFSKTSPAKDDVGNAWLLALDDRSIVRVREGGRFSNAPDTKQQRDIAEAYARTLPMLMMFRMDGDKDKGWGGHPFWWPVLVAPHDAAPVVYASAEATNDND